VSLFFMMEKLNTGYQKKYFAKSFLNSR